MSLQSKITKEGEGASDLSRLNVLSPVKPASLAEVCYTQIKEAIISLDMPPGLPISELQLAQQFAISKSPVREALQRLSHEGLVELEKNRQGRVTPLYPDVVREWYEIRSIIEPESLRLTVQRPMSPDILNSLRRVNEIAIEACHSEDLWGFINNSDRFHIGLAELSSNNTLMQMIKELFDRVRRVRIAMYRHDRPHINNSFTIQGLERHLAVLDLIEADDFTAATQLLQDDISDFLGRFDEGKVERAIEQVSYPQAMGNEGRR